MFLLLVSAFLFIQSPFVFSDDDVPKVGCPPVQDVQPCTCLLGPQPFILCKNIYNPDVLVNILKRSRNYCYELLSLEDSILPYLPHDVFEGVEIHGIYLAYGTLDRLFDKPPKNMQMVKALSLATNISSGIDWHLLQNFKSLEELTVYFNNIPYLGSEFSEYVSDTLTKLTFSQTKTEIIKPGSLIKFKNLDRVEMERCGLTHLSRDIFSSPFNGRFLLFNKNKLTSIPDDLFRDMPKLIIVELKENQLTTLPATAFEGSLSELTFLKLEGNLIICDCRILWLLKDKPRVLGGTCDSPANLKGKKLKNVQPDNLVCSLP